MKKIKCKKCGKIIEGYNENQINYLMLQHKLKCDKSKKKGEMK
jgi:hypothetical protein